MKNGKNGRKNINTHEPHGNQQDKYYVDVALHEKEKKIARWSSFGNKTLWDWGDLLIVPLILGIMTLSWNYRVDQQATHNYRSQLVRNYIDSITELILDQYHHGKISKYPEISVEEVESFVRAKTVNTLQALNPPKHNPSQFLSIGLENLMKFIILGPPERTPKQNLINFLSEAGIGFLPPHEYEQYYNRLLIQNMCPNRDSNAKNPIISEDKDITFDDFLCKIKLPGVVLNDLVLQGVIWEGADLSNAQMRRAILEQADLQKAGLNRVDLREAILTKANLKGAYLHEARLNNTKLNQANLRGAILDKPPLVKGEAPPKSTNLENAELKGVNLRDASLEEVNFENAIMEPFCLTEKDEKQEDDKCKHKIMTNLRNAELEEASFRGTNLKQVNLRGAKLRKTNIHQAAKLEGAIVDDQTQFPESIEEPDEFIKDQKMIKIHCDLDKNQYENNRSEKLNLSDVDLRDACLRNANLSGVDLRRADLRGVDLSNANLEGADLKDALYGDTEENKTKLPISFGSDDDARDAEARRRGMIKLSSEANLEGRDIKYADLSGVNLSNAKLQGTKLSYVDFDDETKWENAEFDMKTELPFDRNTAIRNGMRYAPSDHRYSDSQYGPIPRLVNWEGQNHQKENLQNAILRGGNLKDAILRQTRLQKADLTGADLTGADLTGANLRKAILTDAKLEKADLTDADLRKVIVSNPKDFAEKLKTAFLCRTALPHKINKDLEELDVNANERDCLETDNTLIVIP